MITMPKLHTIELSTINLIHQYQHNGKRFVWVITSDGQLLDLTGLSEKEQIEQLELVAKKQIKKLPTSWTKKFSEANRKSLVYNLYLTNALWVEPFKQRIYGKTTFKQLQLLKRLANLKLIQQSLFDLHLVI